MNPYVVAGLLALFGLDLFTIAFRAALLNASLARLLALREEMETEVNRAVSLLHSPQEWLAGTANPITKATNTMNHNFPLNFPSIAALRIHSASRWVG